MKRRFRLKRAADFKRVRRLGKSYAHPLIVLISHKNDLDITRLGIAAGKPVGKAVQRNRAKRQLREVIRSLIPSIRPGWDIILLARSPIALANYTEIKSAVNTLLGRADLLNKQNVNEDTTGKP